MRGNIHHTHERVKSTRRLPAEEGGPSGGRRGPGLRVAADEPGDLPVVRRAPGPLRGANWVGAVPETGLNVKNSNAILGTDLLGGFATESTEGVFKVGNSDGQFSGIVNIQSFS